MAYSASNPPQIMAQVANYLRLWAYKHTDAETAFDDTDYITNAKAVGMVTGDFVMVVDTTNSLSTIAQVTVDSDGNGTLTALTAFA